MSFIQAVYQCCWSTTKKIGVTSRKVAVETMEALENQVKMLSSLKPHSKLLQTKDIKALIRRWDRVKERSRVLYIQAQDPIHPSCFYRKASNLLSLKHCTTKPVTKGENECWPLLHKGSTGQECPLMLRRGARGVSDVWLQRCQSQTSDHPFEVS